MDPAISRDTTRNTTQRYPWEYPAVATSVEDMSHASDDFATPQQMRADCLEAGRNLGLERAAAKAVGPVPSLRYEDFPREVTKREIRVSDAAARLARALYTD
jgi:hypothetical protein